MEATTKEDNKVVAKLVGAGKEYKAGDTIITALKPSNVELKSGELLLIIGPSGSGKTTLLSLLGCVLYPSFGEVLIGNETINELGESQLAKLRLQKIGFIFQRFNLIAPLTALENVMMPLVLQGLSEKEAKLKAVFALDKVGMKQRMNNLSNDLSGGQQQRVAIARALVTNPSMVLCDEPTASLDLASAGIVMRELKELAKAGKAVAVVTHDARLRPFADRIVYVLEGGISNLPVEEEIATY
jgi:putative ABC transport system ATP-binding protein